MRHAIALHQLERASRARSGPGSATISRPKYSVGSSASISPPVHAQSAGLQNTSPRLRKPVLAADEAAQVADQRPVRDQRALGRAGGAAGVDQHRRIVGARCHRGEVGAFARAAPLTSRRRPAPRPRRPRSRFPARARGRAASRLSMALSSTMATRASLSCKRYSSASGPNSIDSGIAMAPSW